MSDVSHRASYRFDPHDEGIWLGLGLLRLSLVCGSMVLGAAAIYAGDVVVALAFLVLLPPVLLARWEGLPLVAWIALWTAHRLTGSRSWSSDPERVGFVTPLPADPTSPTPTRSSATDDPGIANRTVADPPRGPRLAA